MTESQYPLGERTRRKLMFYSYAKLEDERLKALRSLEEELGKPLVALEEVTLPPARLARGDLDRIREFEQQTGTVLIAVSPG
jgi:hypothetical protein